MKVKTVYSFDDEDGSRSFVDHAINRLAAFKQALDNATPINRVLKNNEFSASDIAALACYLQQLATRARDKWNTLANLASPTELDVQVAESIFQAADNADQAAFDLTEMFNTASKDRKAVQS